jgi:TBC1 domain family member 23
MLQSPSEFMTAVQALLATQEQALTNSAAAAGEHLCFVGSGREDEDQYVHMVVAHFLQRHSQYVSIVSGGYAGMHVSRQISLSRAENGPTFGPPCPSFI